MKWRSTKVIAVLMLSFGSVTAFMFEVPFSADPDVPRVTRKLCAESLGVALFSHPVGGANYCWRDAQDSIRSVHFVADANWSRIVYWRAGETEIHAFGACGSGDGQFRSPGGIDFDRSGRLCAADRRNRRIVQMNYDFEAGTLTFVRNVCVIGLARLDCPFDVKLDDNGTPDDSADDHLWIVDPGQAAIFRMELRDQSLGACYGVNEEQPGAWFDHPVGIAVGQLNGGSEGDAPRFSHAIILGCGHGL